MVVVICAYCGGEYEVKPSRVDTTKFCSQECKNTWQESNLTGKNNPNWNSVESVCQNCEETYTVPKKREKSTKFCSESCKNTWQKKNLTGEDNPNYKDGKTSKWRRYYNSTFHENKEEVIDRDGGCVVCGSNSIDIHHITPLREYSNDPKNVPDSAHSVENMVALCREHHNKYEGEYTDATAEEFVEIVNQNV